jgi:outer membrane protein
LKSIIKFAVASLLISSASTTFAQKAGDFIAGIGGALIVPNASVGTISSTSPIYTALLKDASASVGSSSTVVFSGLYMWTDNIATELTIGIPPQLTIDLTSPSYPNSVNHNGAATAKALTPSLVAKYLFNTPGETWRPYLGLGLTYASFNSVSINTSDTLVNTLAGTSASLSSSWAPVFNAGAIYNINDKWSINASISYVPLKTDATFVGKDGTTTSTGTLTLNPMEYVVRLGYKF